MLILLAVFILKTVLIYINFIFNPLCRRAIGYPVFRHHASFLFPELLICIAEGAPHNLAVWFPTLV